MFSCQVAIHTHKHIAHTHTDRYYSIAHFSFTTVAIHIFNRAKPRAHTHTIHSCASLHSVLWHLFAFASFFVDLKYDNAFIIDERCCCCCCFLASSIVEPTGNVRWESRRLKVNDKQKQQIAQFLFGFSFLHQLTTKTHRKWRIYSIGVKNEWERKWPRVFADSGYSMHIALY